MLRELTVTGSELEPELPEAEGTITAIDYGFEFDLEAVVDGGVNFVNEGPDHIHYTTVEMYPKGVDAVETEDTYAAQLEPGGITTRPCHLAKGCWIGGIFSVGLGSRRQLERPFESGRTYVFACFAQDREGGEPHAIAYDMYEVVTIE